MKISKFLLTFITPVFFATACFAQDAIKLHFINIGEGDAILIQSRTEACLIDTGSLLSGYKLIDYLKKQGVKKLKYLIISHPHPDHAAGAFFIVPKFKIDGIYDNGQAVEKSEQIYRWYDSLIRRQPNYRALKQGDILNLDNNLRLEVLWPKAMHAASVNANSLVIMLEYNPSQKSPGFSPKDEYKLFSAREGASAFRPGGSTNFKCLFTGDLNNIGEKGLLQEASNLKADILKVGHHGYLDATSLGFLDAVSCKFAIISVDADNIADAPSKEVLDLLRQRGVTVYRTDKNGNIIVRVDRKGAYHIKTGN